jgi:hypothetical protein
VRSQRNPAYRKQSRWELSPRGRLVWRVVCAAIVVALVLSGQWVTMVVFLVLVAVAEVIEAIRSGAPRAR